jgi:DNA-binding CsgD family transcriptional regulator
MMIARIVALARHAWRGIAGGGKRKPAGRSRRGLAGGQAKRADATRAEARRLIAAGHSQAEAARRLGVTRQYVHKLIHQ